MSLSIAEVSLHTVNSTTDLLPISFYQMDFCYDSIGVKGTVGEYPYFKLGTPDLDYLINPVLDALEGILYLNDSAIVCFSRVRKLESTFNCIDLTMRWDPPRTIKSATERSE